jgi:hypothetical protein
MRHTVIRTTHHSKGRVTIRPYAETDTFEEAVDLVEELQKNHPLDEFRIDSPPTKKPSRKLFYIIGGLIILSLLASMIL